MEINEQKKPVRSPASRPRCADKREVEGEEKFFASPEVVRSDTRASFWGSSSQATLDESFVYRISLVLRIKSRISPALKIKSRM